MAGRYITREKARKLAPVERLWLSRMDIQIMMGVGEDYIKELKARGEFPPPSHYVGKEARWWREDVLNFLASLAERLRERQGVGVEETERERRDKLVERCRRMRGARRDGGDYDQGRENEDETGEPAGAV